MDALSLSQESIKELAWHVESFNLAFMSVDEGLAIYSLDVAQLYGGGDDVAMCPCCDTKHVNCVKSTEMMFHACYLNSMR